MEQLSPWKQFRAGTYKGDPRVTPEQSAHQIAFWRGYEIYLRARNDALDIWQDCNHKQCVRGRACLADPAQCGAAYFHELASAAKFWWKTAIDTHCAGAPVDEALRAATAKLHQRNIELPAAATRVRLGTALRRLAAQDRVCGPR